MATKKKAKPRIVKDFTLPPFNLERLLQHIQDCVDKAPYGIIQLIIDLFCGAGGTSEGIEQALAETGEKCAVIIAGINHDDAALYSQAINHPLAYYSTEDIRTANLQIIKQLIDICRERWPQCPIIVWASAECTNHSNAKGGMSREADSRTQPWDLYRYMRVLKPDGLWMENVKEFSEWGPLMEKVIMVREGKKQTLQEPITPELEQEYYRSKIADGWICTCPINTKIKKRKTKKQKALPPELLKPIWIPIKKLKGTFYQPWKKKIEGFGFHSQEWLLNAADYGVPQNRKRLFPMFMKKGMPIVRPEPTHAKNPIAELYGGLKKHVPIKTCLDFTVEGESIFTPGKIKSPKSFERYYEGLIKHVAGGKDAFMQQSNGGAASSKIFSMDDPSRTVLSSENKSLVQAYFITKMFSSNNNTKPNAGSSIEEPSPTILTKASNDLVSIKFIARHFGHEDPKDANPGTSIEDPSSTIMTNPTQQQLMDVHFIGKYNSNNLKDEGVNKGSDINDPSPTVTTQERIMLVKASFISKYGSDWKNGALNPGHSIEEPSKTITTMNHFALVDAHYIDVYHGTSSIVSVENASPTVIAADCLSLLNVKYLLIANNPENKAEPFVISPHFDNAGNSVEEPSTTITAGRKHHYIVNPSHGGHSCSIENPSGTIIARQDKAPVSLITVDEVGNMYFGIAVYNDDLPIVVKIKEFMALYGISDIKMRMLMVPELLKIQSFPENYYLASSQTDQKKFIGNAVPPKVARVIAESMYAGLVKYIVQKLKLAA